MNTENTTFLIECDRQSNITNTFWYQPVYLLSPYQKQLGDIFTASHREKVDQTLRQAFSFNGVLACQESFQIASSGAEVSLCLSSKGDKVLVHGIEIPPLAKAMLAPPVKDVIGRFMKVIQDSSQELVSDNDKMVRNQFEQIQKLNNDFLNTQRQLKKANSMLNKLNRDLNNRLVKDALTGLVSRYQYREEIEMAISKFPEKLGIFAFIDVDDFKTINDTYGHRAGDEFLKEFARRLLSLPYEEMICMRIAGDEFGIYVHGFDSVAMEDIRKMWENIQKHVIREPVIVDSTSLNILCSAGMAVYGEDTEDIFDLIEYADFAMYQAKNSGKNSYSFFDMDEYKDKKTSIL